MLSNDPSVNLNFPPRTWLVRNITVFKAQASHRLLFSSQTLFREFGMLYQITVRVSTLCSFMRERERESEREIERESDRERE